MRQTMFLLDICIDLRPSVFPLKSRVETCAAEGAWPKGFIR